MANKQNLIIDGQILQTTAWHRGMGKYMLQLLHELDVLLAQTSNLSIIFNDQIECEQQRFTVIKYLCPNIQQFHTTLPLTEDKHATPEKYKTELTAFIDKNFSEFDNHYLITSLFTFSFLAQFPINCRRLLLIYDLTPLLFWKDLGGYFPPHLYMKRFMQIYEAERVFCISETVRQDIIKIFGLDPRQVVNIDGGFTKISAEAQEPHEFRVPEHYILFPTGDLPHKNNKIAVQGFSEFNKRSGDRYRLFITSSFSQKSKKVLAGFSNEIIFTGNVSDEELHWLYLHADTVLFASKYEGLGIPILDAVANNKPIVTSQIPVFEEMSAKAFYYFNPSSKESLSKALDKALQGTEFEDKSKSYPAILAKYTWERTGKAFAGALKNLVPTSGGEGKPQTPKPKIAVICPHPGINGQVGRLAESLHRSLSEDFDIDYYFDPNNLSIQEMERPTFLDYIGAQTFDIVRLSRRRYRSYKAAVYLLDNAALSMRIAQYAYILPGLVFHTFDNDLPPRLQTVKTITLEEGANVHQIDPRANAVALGKDIAGRISKYLESRERGNASERERLIRAKGTNRSIMKRLIARTQHDK